MTKKILLALSFIFYSCLTASGWDLGQPVSSDVREWTILIYMDGDNNLEQWALNDLKELEEGISLTEGKVDVLVMLDRAKDYSNKMGDWTDTRIFHVKKSLNKEEINSELLAKCGELNMGDPATLEKFINDGIKKFPSKKTALVMWDHGAGWVNMANDNEAPGKSGGDELLLSELKTALKNTSHLFPNGKLDLIAFDMCLMGQIDVIAACANFARYMTAGATVLPAVGMDYLAALPLFAQNLSTEEIVKRMVPAACSGFLNINWTTASLSAFDLSKTQNLINSCKNLFEKLEGTLKNSWGDVTRAIFYSLNYVGASDYRNKEHSLSSIDFQDWLNRIKNMPLGANLADEIKNTELAIKDIILNTEAGPDIPQCKGLSIYAPLRSENLRTDYQNTDFNSSTGWSDTLGKIYAMQKLRGKNKPEIKSIKIGTPVLKIGVIKPKSGADYDIIARETFTPMSGSNFNNANRSYIKVNIEGNSILYAYGGFAFSNQRDGDYIVYFQQLLPAENMSGNDNEDAKNSITPIFKDGKNELMYQFAGTFYAFSNGEEFAPVMVKAVDIANPNVLTVEGIYTDPDLNNVEIPVIIKIDANFYELVSFTGIINSGKRTIAVPIIPSGKGSFKPKVIKIEKGTGKFVETFGRPIKFNDNLAFLVNLLPPDTWVRPLAWAESIGGTGGVRAGSPVKALANPVITPLINNNKNFAASLKSRLLGRYAVISAVKNLNGAGYIMAANGVIMEFKGDNNKNVFDAVINAPSLELNKRSGEILNLNAHLQSRGLPILRLITPKAKKKGYNLEAADYALFNPNNGRPFWRLINANDGNIQHLIPLNKRFFPDNWLNGDWSSDDGVKFSFNANNGNSGKVTFSFNNLNSGSSTTADYSLIDNRIFITLPDGRQDIIFAVYDPSERMLVLTLTGENAGEFSAVALKNLNKKSRQNFNNAIEIFN